MKVYIHLEINDSGIKTDKGCMQQFQTLAAAKEALREIQRNALRQGFNALFLMENPFSFDPFCRF